MTISTEYHFFYECFKNYWDGNQLIPLLFIIALGYLATQKNKFWNKNLLFPFLFGCCTIFNPILMNAVFEKINWYDRYYRFYWIVPISLIISIVLADFLDKISSKIFKICLGIIICIIILYCGNIIPGILHSENWNIYKIDYNAIEISEIIHNDTTEPSPVVFVDVNIAPVLRQYDPSLMSVLNMSNANEIISLTHDLEEVYDLYMTTTNKILLNIETDPLFCLMGNYNVEIDPSLINGRLKAYGIHYYVRNKYWFSDEYMQLLNITKIGETNIYEVYRVIY